VVHPIVRELLQLPPLAAASAGKADGAG
jgi:hypothetical protein